MKIYMLIKESRKTFFKCAKFPLAGKPQDQDIYYIILSE